MRLNTKLDINNALKSDTVKGPTQEELYQLIRDKTVGITRELQQIHSKRNESGHAFDTELGVINSPYDEQLIDDVYKVIGELTSRDRIKITDVVMCGIGGSELGATALITAYGREDINYHPITSLNNDNIVKIRESIDPEGTVLLKVTRSNTTKETLTAFNVFKKYLENKLGDNYKKHCVAVVGKSIVKDSIDEGYHAIGIERAMSGRFTGFHAANIMTMALMGVDIRAFEKGAANMLEYCINAESIDENPALQLAALQYWWNTEGNKTVFHTGVFSPKLVKYGDWLDQLTEESLGHREDIKMSTKTTELSNKLHSDFQNWIAGANIFLHHFVFLLKSKYDSVDTETIIEANDGKRYSETLDSIERAAYLATATALVNKGRPNYTTFLSKIDEANMGELMMRDMLKTIYLGEMFGLGEGKRPDGKSGKDYFFQAGVEAYKTLMKGYLTNPDENDFVRKSMMLKNIY